MSKNARLAKVKEELFKCFKWVLACINKFKKPAIPVKAMAKPYRKASVARAAKEKRY